MGQTRHFAAKGRDWSRLVGLGPWDARARSGWVHGTGLLLNGVPRWRRKLCFPSRSRSALFGDGARPPNRLAARRGRAAACSRSLSSRGDAACTTAPAAASAAPARGPLRPPAPSRFSRRRLVVRQNRNFWRISPASSLLLPLSRDVCFLGKIAISCECLSSRRLRAPGMPNCQAKPPSLVASIPLGRCRAPGTLIY